MSSFLNSINLEEREFPNENRNEKFTGAAGKRRHGVEAVGEERCVDKPIS